MGLRDDLIELVDDIREDVVDGVAELRLWTVETRSRTWAGGKPGSGIATDVDTEISPKPKVSNPPPHLVESAGGKYREGDRVVSKISGTYTRAQLDGGSMSGGSEWFIRISDDGGVTYGDYRVIGEPSKRFLEWRLHVRPTRKR